MTPDELIKALHVENLTTEKAVENIITIYQAAKAEIDAIKAVQDMAKARLAEIIEETGQATWSTAAGKVSVTAPSVSVRWDSKALDALMASNDENARLLSPFRTESELAGTLRITAAK